MREPESYVRTGAGERPEQEQEAAEEATAAAASRVTPQAKELDAQARIDEASLASLGAVVAASGGEPVMQTTGGDESA